MGHYGLLDFAIDDSLANNSSQAEKIKAELAKKILPSTKNQSKIIKLKEGMV